MTLVEKAIRDKILQKMPYGLYVVGTKSVENVAAIIVNWVTQVSFEPPMIAVAIESDSDMKVYIERSNLFSVNLLPTGSRSIAKAFLKKSKHIGNTINEMRFSLSTHGMPYFDDAVDSFECSVVHSLQTGDHRLFIGEIIDGITKGEHEILSLKETGWKYRR